MLASFLSSDDFNFINPNLSSNKKASAKEANLNPGLKTIYDTNYFLLVLF
jgi:hypothetical protein